MALDKPTLIQDIKDIQDELKDETNYETAKQKFAEKLADAIEKYHKSGTVAITGTSNQGPFTGSGTIS
ncbi:hypothetical protein [Epilithonimonas mollis]|uniref:Uncharacterized protein n=1 Tax=Epilithonimonas mollis TaxID=216903 RepID=A0A1M6UL20_9FLAO|nr:hypothetical protein [Epilithonimonas mollis]SHK69830.1 hypothetical protein SAMN05444371_3359 [Epilithonimonas mollis]